MKTSAITVILVIACLGLGAVLFVQSGKHAEESAAQVSTIINFSNNVNTLEGKLSEQRTVNQTLETNLGSARMEFSNTVAELAAATNELTNVNARLEETKTAAATAATAAADALAQREKKIADLESQNQGLDKEASELRATITNLDSQIQATQKKLAASEGDRQLLLGELKQLRTAKDDLEKKFNNLLVLKEQVRKIKGELALERKLDWIRRGVYDSIKVKGGELLTRPRMATPPATNGGMEVEIRQSTGARIVSPDSTNAPAGK